MSSDEKKISGTLYNFKNDWKYKIGGHQKATGEFQLEVKIHSDSLDLLPETFVKLLGDTIKCCEENSFSVVKPKEYKKDNPKGE